jgi:hypothetical protein
MKAPSPAASTSPSLVGVPSLNELAERPALAQALPLETAQALLIQCALIQSVLLGRLVTSPRAPEPLTPAEPEEWLNAAQVEVRFGLPKSWLIDHAAELRQRRIVSKPSRKLVVYHRGRLTRLLEAKCGP